jgi:hypothetical protein
MKTNILAQMEAASFCGGVRHKRYSGQPELAPENNNYKFRNQIISMKNTLIKTIERQSTLQLHSILA